MVRRTRQAEFYKRLRNVQASRKPDPPRIVAQPEPATPPEPGKLAILFRVPWARMNVGWDILARLYARTMYEAGMDVRLYPPADQAGGHAEALAEAGRFARRVSRHDLYVYSDFFASPSVMWSIVKRHLSVPGPRVFYSMFERLRVAPETGSLLNTLTGVWVPCTANRDALIAAGARNAVWFPVPFFDDDPLLSLRPPQQARAFYWIGAWEARKAPDNLLRAFFRAFCPGEATLLLKSTSAQDGWPSPESCIASMLPCNGWTSTNWRSGVTVDRRTLSRAAMLNEVHGRNDVYVSASRGEGVDMPAYSAKLAGRRVITTDSGGPRDFLGEHDILIPATGEVPTHPSYNWEPGSSNADYSLNRLVSTLQRVRAEPVPPRDLPDPSIFRARAVGIRMKEQIERWIQ